MRVVNPYTFVPFAKGVSRLPYDRYYDSTDAPLVSGYLDIDIVTKSEMIIPDASGIPSEGGQQNSIRYPFYKVDGKPAIPGSEIRGLLRSVYEAATNSCVPFLPDNRPFSLRTPAYGSYKNRGLLECQNGVWKLYEARVYRKKVGGKAAVRSGTWNGRSNGDMVSFIPSGRNDFTLVDSTNPNGEPGILQFNVPVVAMRNGVPVEYSVAVLQPARVLYTWPDTTPYDALKESLGSSTATLPSQSLLSRLKSIKSQGGMIPVWYLAVTRAGKPMYYLSGSSIGRVHQHRAWNEIMGEHSPCKSVDALCPACALFGTVKDGGRHGRIRVEDAELTGNAAFSYHILQPLAGPRPSAYEFYLEKPEPEANYWNYDYHGVRWKNPDSGRMETEYRDSSEAGPRGRKFYWHHDHIAPDDRMATKMNSTMEAVKPGARFSFRLHFDRITDEQLSQIIWTINLGENSETSTLQHKLGHAKPLGYGSVKLLVKEGRIRTLRILEDGNIQSELKPVDKLETQPFQTSIEPVRSLLAVADTRKTIGLHIEYPRKGRDIFSWFAKNRTVNGLTVLPKPTDSDITLEADNVPGLTSAPQSSLPSQPKLDPSGLCGKIVDATIWSITPEKHAIRLNLPHRARGFLFDSDGEVAKNYRVGDTITVKILEYDPAHTNYKTKRR